MATSYKTLLASDITPIRSNLHEAIPITGSIISGTYGPNVGNDNPLNVKNYSHGMFTSIYDYPYLSSSANQIFDVTIGIGKGSSLSASTTSQIDQKLQIYNQMAQVLVGNNVTGGINLFDRDGVDSDNWRNKMREVIFFNFSRLLSKDEIQKGSFNLQLGVGPSASNAVGPFGSPGAGETIAATDAGLKLLNITDASGSNAYKVNSPAGDYGILYATGSSNYVLTGSQAQNGGLVIGGGIPCGLLYYQTGIAVLTASVFQTGSTIAGKEVDINPAGLGAGVGSYLGTSGMLAKQICLGHTYNGSAPYTALVPMQSASLALAASDVDHMLANATVSGSSNAIANRIYNVTFNNTTELNSTVYFCRANSNEFNYSSNPTYLTQSKIRVKEVRSDEPSTYVTSVGLYSPDNALLAVAKLSEPIKKQPSNEFTLRVRLDY
jgi:hypothetical protein